MKWRGDSSRYIMISANGTRGTLSATLVHAFSQVDVIVPHLPNQDFEMFIGASWREHLDGCCACPAAAVTGAASAVLPV